MKTFAWKNATPEQLNLWNLCNGLLIGWNTIVPLYFFGAIVGSEFETYNAAKMYIYLEMVPSVVGASANIPSLQLFDVNNVSMGLIGSAYPVWDVTAAALKYSAESIIFKNGYFSRIIRSVYASMKFNGYRLNII